MDNVNITRIDAPFPEQWRDEMYQFVNELKAIRTGIDVLNTNTAKSADATNKLAKWYEEGGKSPVASVAQAQEQTQQRLLGADGRPIGASRPSGVSPEDLVTQEIAAKSALGSMREGWASGGLAGAVSGYWASRPPGAKMQVRDRHEIADEEEASAEGGVTALPGSSGGSSGASYPGGSAGWAQQYRDVHGPMTIPRAGEFTAQNLLEFAASSAATLANSKYVSSGSTAQGLIAMMGQGSQWTADKVLPPLAMARQYGSQFSQMSQGLENFGGSLGYQQTGAASLGPLGTTNDISLGPLNFRPPGINPAALQGIQQYAGSFMDAMTIPGLSTGQSAAFKQSLAERGWFPGQSQQQSMYDALTQLNITNPDLATNSGVTDLMDKATRSGTTSMKDMLQVIKSIPDAAKQAHEGIQQMVADMNTFGDYSQSQGGTHFAGQQQALQISSVTGMPASAMTGLINSPWTTSSIFRSTGQPDWMQGALPGSVKNQGAMQGFFQAARAVGRPQNTTIKQLGGFTQTVSGLQQQAAMMHKFFYPDMNPETIMKFLRMGPQGMQHRNQVSGAAQAWEQEALSIMRDPHASNADRDVMLSGGLNQGTNFGHLLKVMENQKTATGARMFSQDDIRKIRAAGVGEHGESLVQAKYNAVQHILGSKASKMNMNAGSPSNAVTIDLSPAARKFLQLPNKKSQYKLQAGAGERTNVNAANVGYTDPIIPGTDLTNSGTYVPPNTDYSYSP